MNTVRLSEKLKQSRLTKKMTRADVSVGTGMIVTADELRSYENGERLPAPQTLGFLASALELPLHYLLILYKIECSERGEQ
jgi:transcriptional regulator with XRE-family HTH domain